MKKFVIIGNSSYAEMMRNYIEQAEAGIVLAYAVDNNYIQQKEIGGISVFSFEKLRETYTCEEVSLIMGIGYKNMGRIREKIFEQCKSWGYRFENYIHPTALIAKDVILGEGNNILEGVILEAGVIIGDANLFFGGSLIAHETVIGNFNTFSVKAVVAGCTSIQNHCFLGAASVVKDHVVLKDYVLVGASAYGFEDMESYSVIVPAESKKLEGRKSIEFL